MKNKLVFRDDHVEIVVESETHGTHSILVDIEDLELVSKYRWYLNRQISKSSGDVSFYAVTNIRTERGGNQRSLKMHRLILGLDFGDSRWADHKNHDTLDNRRKNLRPCSPSENAGNRNKMGGTSSKYKGVSFNLKNKNFVSQIVVDGKSVHLGHFKTQKEAAIQYDKAAFSAHREFASLNFPEVDYSKYDFDIENFPTPGREKKSSKFTGVSWDRKNKKWETCLRVDRKLIHLGRFKEEGAAAKAYNDYVTRHKLKRKLNKIEEVKDG